MGFVMDKVALGQAFPCQFSFHGLHHIHHLSSRAGTIGQLVADVPSELSLTLSLETYKNYYLSKTALIFIIFIVWILLLCMSIDNFILNLFYIYLQGQWGNNDYVKCKI
jgi:hypothetical protein